MGKQNKTVVIQYAMVRERDVGMMLSCEMLMLRTLESGTQERAGHACAPGSAAAAPVRS
jgi:hypothetical protein